MDKRFSIQELADEIKGEISGGVSHGDVAETRISGVAAIEEASAGDLTFAIDEKYVQQALASPAGAVIVSRKLVIDDSSGKILIRTDNPRLAYAKVLSLFADPLPALEGINDRASVAASAKIGDQVAIGPFVPLGGRVVIGDHVRIYPNTTIMDDSVIGSGTLIHSGVSLYQRITVGRNCLIHSGVVLGADGFGFERVKKQYLKIPQIGTVEIGDDVEIGANVCIDRGTTGVTQIGNRVKIDNLVHIAHNVKIGDDSMIIAQVGISGSARIGCNVTIAGQAGLASHVQIGDNVVIAAKSGVTKSVPADMEVSGFPARPHQDEKRLKVSLLRLPGLIQGYQQVLGALQRISDRLSKLEKLFK